ncbi:LacI family transcriptional regulator [Paenibacillus sp. UNCCL117]|uniref:LacI family DNA-binding transcriptional regulator n=1 Tax=unclassified Paenibacillus TaxID=185978 RepID=UPI00088FB131|nr:MULTISPECIES: LacI family DNA-binding transcriptional regulator [unclassified Paenibacillus]SDD92757.1 transcriptional regulator, LacI family [Paenibacillus sp. cl123]SFW43387.1 LacI family transcriptional regulator [Paenibacillus sp. UNCCL117]
MASRKQVAEKAGVSVATVSYVLNDKPGVSDAVREKVRSAIDELGYKPSYAARALKTKKTNCLSVFVNYIGDPFEAGLLNTMEHRARELGYFIYFHTYQQEEEEDFRHYFAGRIDGLLLLGQSLKEETLRSLAAEGIPVISVMEPVRAEGLTAYIDIDWEAAMAAGISHLKTQGHRNIGFMANGGQEHPHERRTQAFLAVMKREGLPVNEGTLLYGEGRLEQAQEAMLRYIKDGMPGGHSAFMTASDLMAAGMLAACREARVPVPGKLAIVGCEDIMMTLHTTPAITVLHYPRPEIAALAVERMVGHLNGKPAASTRLESSLIVRDSSRLL